VVYEVVEEDIALFAGVAPHVENAHVVGLQADVVYLVELDDVVVAVQQDGPQRGIVSCCF
jgi:hypothetical protein